MFVFRLPNLLEGRRSQNRKTETYVHLGPNGRKSGMFTWISLAVQPKNEMIGLIRIERIAFHLRSNIAMFFLWIESIR